MLAYDEEVDVGVPGFRGRGRPSPRPRRAVPSRSRLRRRGVAEPGLGDHVLDGLLDRSGDAQAAAGDAGGEVGEPFLRQAVTGVISP